MLSIYKMLGGRKMFVFYLLLLINAVAFFLNLFSSDFANFCIMLFSVVIVGNVSSKFTKEK